MSDVLIKRGNLGTEADTERGKMILRDPRRRWPSTSQEERPHIPQKETTLPTSWFGFAPFRTVWQYIVLFKQPSYGTLSWQPLV